MALLLVRFSFVRMNAPSAAPSNPFVLDIDSNLGFIHTLFAIEEIVGQVHLVFDVKKTSTDQQIFQMFMSWAKQAEKLPKNNIINGDILIQEWINFKFLQKSYLKI